jgi:hypothetical protein
MQHLYTYQYHNPKLPIEADEATIWIAAPSEVIADYVAIGLGFVPCGGQIFNDRETHEMLREMAACIDVGIDMVVYSIPGKA